MQNTASLLHRVHAQLAPPNETLQAARSRRDDVLKEARKYNGALRTYISGSIAHRTANKDTDADCGMVLDRRSYPRLGPDGGGERADRVVQDVRVFLRGRLKSAHPKIKFRVTKRAIKITFNEPLRNGADPSVDLIVALTRRGKAGIWIPNLEMGRWDASDPERHTKLLTASPAELRRTRARVIRLAKGWNSQFNPHLLCSFNIEALALECIGEEHKAPDGLAELFRYAASSINRRLTLDPAGVSGSIKLLDDRGKVVRHLRRASDRMRDALSNDNDRHQVKYALSRLYRDYIPRP